MAKIMTSKRDLSRCRRIESNEEFHKIISAIPLKDFRKRMRPTTAFNPYKDAYDRQIEISKAIKDIYDSEERETENMIHSFNVYFN